jgi:hypothetical protein
MHQLFTALQGVDAVTHTTAVSNWNCMSSPLILSVSTQTEDLPTSAVPGLKLCAYQPPADDVAQPHIICQKFRANGHVGPSLIQEHRKML